MKKYLSVLVTVLMVFAGLGVSVYAEESPVLPSLMISELQVGGLSPDGVIDGRQEFIELYNPRTERIDITGWRLEYLSAAHAGVGIPTRVLTELKGVVGPQSFALIGWSGLPDADGVWMQLSSVSGYLAQGGGHVRLVDAAGQVIEQISWGNVKVIGAWARLIEIPAGRSAQRVLPHHKDFTGLQEYKVSAETSPEGGGLIVELPPVPACELRLSEIMSNPAGVDAGREYIELYNPTDVPQSLANCSLRIGETAPALALPAHSVAPGSYAVVRDEIGFSLPNASAATVWLLGGSLREEVKYADALPDDHVWWLRDGSWEINRLGTPVP